MATNVLYAYTIYTLYIEISENTDTIYAIKSSSL